MENAREVRYPAPRPPQRPTVTFLLIIMNSLVFLAMFMFRGGPGNIEVLLRFGALDPILVWQGEFYRLLTAIFLHIDLKHLLFNMFALYMLGSLLEPFYGSRRFVFIYFLSGLAGNLVSQLFMEGISAGASGAVLGLAGALLSRISSIKGRVPEPSRRSFFFTILFLIIFDVLLGFTSEQINNEAHIGGLLSGWWLSYAMVLTEKRTRWRNLMGRTASLAFVLGMILLTVCSLFPVWNARYFMALADAEYNQKDYPEAARYLERAVQIDPAIGATFGVTRAFRHPYRFLARYFYDKQQFDKALLYGRREAARVPSDYEVHEWLERSYRQLGMDREADAEMEFVLAAMAKQVAEYPRNPYTLNNLAYALAERGLLLDRALELAIEANERTSYEKPVILDTLAWVLFKKGDFEGAEKIMGTLPAEESDPIYLYHLGAILIAKGDIEQGKALIEQALDEGLHWWDAKHAREILDSLNPSV